MVAGSCFSSQEPGPRLIWGHDRNVALAEPAGPLVGFRLQLRQEHSINKPLILNTALVRLTVQMAIAALDQAITSVPSAPCGEIHHWAEMTCCRYAEQDRKSTRLNSSHVAISYAV